MFRPSTLTWLPRHNTMMAIAAVAVFVLMSCAGTSKDERFKRDCDEYTERYCPKREDRCQVLDSITYDIPTRSIHRWFSVGGELDSAGIYTERVVEDMRESLCAHVSNNLALRKYKDEGVTFVYHYASASTSKEYFSVTLTKEDY